MRLARAVLLWERVWPSLWPATGIAGLFLAAALFALPQLLPWPLHALLLAATVSAMGLSLYASFEGFGWPTWREGARRVERDSTLLHRPISERDDSIAAGRGDELAEALWRLHLSRHLAGIASLRPSWPRSALPARDPRALRYVVLLLVAAGLLIAAGDWRARLAAAFGPGSGEAAGITIDAWIDPPAYTGLAPIYLDASQSGSLAIPAGSTLNLRVHGASHAPYVSLSDTGFSGSEGEYGASAKLMQSDHVIVRAGGRTIGNWRIEIIADKPPTVAFAAKPSRTEHDALKLSFNAQDDYGVASVRALITPHGRYGKTLAVDLPLDQPSAKKLAETTFRDLTAHPYAGMDADIVLEASDGAGQKAQSKPMRVTLPARVFTNPLARALVEQRQVLATGDIRLRPRVTRAVEALSLAPELFYQDQLGVYLALRSAYWTLKNASRDEEYAQASDLLWQIALGLERGGLMSAAEELRRVKQMLSEAFARNAPQGEIDSLLERYQQALQRYLKALAENPPDASQPVPPDAKVLSQQDIDALLKAIEQLAQSGNRAQAEQMLALLQELLENLRLSGGAGSGSGQQSPQDKALSDAIQGLGDLMGKQRGLVDKTFRQGQGKGDPKDGGPKGLAGQQRALRDQLDKIMKGLGGQKLEVPKTLGDAGKSMGQAQGELDQQDLPNAGIDERQALDALRKTAGDLAKQLMQRSKGEGQGDGTDPLGRAQGTDGNALGGNVKVPSQSDLQRAREILKELRRRAGERGRSQQELDYIDRLLKQF
ncbi:MAG: TIGR02302 family protein [Alphaproteobacteria bacterium]|nr:TIGR02302 family protein [Alphaproteobacteria bacterium]